MMMRHCWVQSTCLYTPSSAKLLESFEKLKFRKQLSLLKLLIKTDKTVIPAILKKQDRGRMKFPQQCITILSLKGLGTRLIKLYCATTAGIIVRDV